MSAAARDVVIDLVHGITPEYDAGDPFECIAPADGAGADLESYASRRRAFDLITLSWPVDGGIATATAPLYRETWGVRVSYPAPLPNDRERLVRAIASDQRAIWRALLSPTGWTAVLDNLHVGVDPPTIEAVSGIDGEIVAYHSTIPFTVEYY